MNLAFTALITIALVSIWCANHAERLYQVEHDARDWSEVAPPDVPFE